MNIGERKLGVMIRDAEVQVTLDNVPVIKSYGENEDREVSEKSLLKGLGGGGRQCFKQNLDDKNIVPHVVAPVIFISQVREKKVKKIENGVKMICKCCTILHY